jgi:CheY-like chemotaxis protein
MARFPLARELSKTWEVFEMTRNVQSDVEVDSTLELIVKDQPPAIIAELDSGHEQSQHRSLRSLVVDDERHVSDTLCAMVSSWGHQGRTSYDGHTGLADAGQHLPNVVLLDIEMPGMDGYELARQLRLSPDLQGCYLIAMRSPRDLLGNARRESSIDLFLRKPLNLSVLETLMRMEGERLDRMA